jgi:drug/metabolite transporter (DMT)-like permease
MKVNTKVWAALLAVYIVWGSTYLGIRFAVETIPPFFHAAVRFLVAGTFLFVWRRMSGDPAPTKQHWRSAIIVGTLLLVGGNGLISLAEVTIPSGVAALIVATIPMFMVLIEALRPGGAKPSLGQAIGLLIGFGGVALLIGPADFGGGTKGISLIGGGIAVSAAFLWALGSIYNRTAELPESSLLFTGMEMLMGSIGLFIVSGLMGEFGQLNIAKISTPSLLGLLYLITFGSLIGFTSYAWLLRNAPVSLVSTYPYVNPIVAVFLGNLFLKEPLTGRVLLAAGIIVGSVILINMAKKPAPKVLELEESAAD